MAKIQLTKDFKEFLQLLNDHAVEYLVVGGYAVNYHGYVRYTGDIDVWVAIHQENAEKLATVLQEFGFSAETVQKQLFMDKDKVLQIGIPPTRIDILMGVSGIEFADCYARRIADELDGVPINIVHIEDLMANKRASGRFKDLNDLENLP